MYKVGFLGSGRMAKAMIRGMLNKGFFKPHDIICRGGSGTSAHELARETKIEEAASVRQVVEESELLVLAFKPHHLESLDSSLDEGAAGKGVLSVLAGIPIDKIYHHFPTASNIVRAMPNIPAAVGSGITGYTPWKALEGRDQSMVSSILKAMGRTVEVEEHQLDAVTGVSGSGIAFVYEFMIALRDGGIRLGLSEAQSTELCLHTVLGAAELLRNSQQTLDQLRDQVVTPGGTTEAGLNTLAAGDFDTLVKNAVSAAAERSRELSGS